MNKYGQTLPTFITVLSRYDRSFRDFDIQLFEICDSSERNAANFRKCLCLPNGSRITDFITPVLYQQFIAICNPQGFISNNCLFVMCYFLGTLICNLLIRINLRHLWCNEAFNYQLWLWLGFTWSTAILKIPLKKYSIWTVSWWTWKINKCNHNNRTVSNALCHTSINISNALAQ